MNNNENRPVLEVIACSVADAIEAEQGGANRLEVISHFEAGGLTPPIGLVREILAVVRLPIRVMVRESEGYSAAGEPEIGRLCAAASDFSTLKIDGLVLGFLREGEADHALLARILSCAPQLKATFHHAFDAAQDQFQTIAALKQHAQIDRILTGGGGGGWQQKTQRLICYQQSAAPEISILVGGGVNSQAIRKMRTHTSLNEFHVGSAARYPPDRGGNVQSSRVKELARTLLINSVEGFQSQP